jgi:hypothetical protein
MEISGLLIFAIDESTKVVDGFLFIYSCGWFMTYDFPDIFHAQASNFFRLKAILLFYQSTSFAGTTWMEKDCRLT